MKVMMQMHWDGVTPEQYDKMRKSVGMDENIPAGLVFHAAGFKDDAISVTDVWESADDFNAFVQNHLMSAAKEAEVEGQPHVEIFPLHATLAPAFTH
jgi:hypothetical protein